MRAMNWTIGLTLLVSGCGGKVVVDEPVGQGGAMAGPSSTGSGTISSSSSTDIAGTTVTSGPSTTVGTTSGGGSVGGCFGCAEYITECVTQSQPPPDCAMPTFCPGSQPIFDALFQCVCAQCAGACEKSCGNGAADGPNCSSCETNAAQTVCQMQFGACANDV